MFKLQHSFCVNALELVKEKLPQNQQGNRAINAIT